MVNPTQVVIREILTATGQERETSCLNLHSSKFPDDLSVPGDGYRELLGITTPGPSRPSFQRYPLNPATGDVWSHPRCFYLAFSPPFGQLTDVRFWLTPFTAPTGWTFQIAVSPTLQGKAWRPASEHMADPLTASRRPNLMRGYETRPGSVTTWEPKLQLDTAESGVDGYATPYVSMRARVTNKATAGPPLGVDGDGLAHAIEWNFAWQ